MIELQGISKTFNKGSANENHLLNDFHLTVKKDEFTFSINTSYRTKRLPKKQVDSQDLSGPAGRNCAGFEHFRKLQNGFIANSW